MSYRRINVDFIFFCAKGEICSKSVNLHHVRICPLAVSEQGKAPGPGGGSQTLKSDAPKRPWPPTSFRFGWSRFPPPGLLYLLLCIWCKSTYHIGSQLRLELNTLQHALVQDRPSIYPRHLPTIGLPPPSLRCAGEKQKQAWILNPV